MRNLLPRLSLATAQMGTLMDGLACRRSSVLWCRCDRVGVIGVRNPDFDANRWWQYSDGVREVLGETIAYGYAKFFVRRRLP